VLRWLGSRVVSVPVDSGSEGPGFKSQPWRCLRRQSVHTHRASVRQTAKLVVALLRVARVTAGLAESNDSLPPGLWLMSRAGWLQRTEISSGTLRSAIEYRLPLTITFNHMLHQVLPERSFTAHNLQPSWHYRTLPSRPGRLFNNNFIIRMLYLKTASRLVACFL